MIGLFVLVLTARDHLSAQDRSAASGWSVNALPASNFDGDEGFGYGVIFFDLEI